MHKIAISQSIIDRVIARRGREHIHDDLDPARAPRWSSSTCRTRSCCPGVAHALCLEAQEIVPNINRLAQAVRETGGAVVWIQTAFTDATPKEWSAYYAISKPEQNAKRNVALARGSKGHELWETLDARPDDIYVEKNRFSGLHPGLLEYRRGAARQRHRHHPGHRHGHQCVLRIDRARRHDVQL